MKFLPVYLPLSTLDFLEEGEVFLAGGGLYPCGLYLADLGGPLALILVAIFVGTVDFLDTDNSRVASDVSIVCGFLIELVPSLGNEPVE